jgi:hypothetical protein
MCKAQSERARQPVFVMPALVVVRVMPALVFVMPALVLVMPALVFVMPALVLVMPALVIWEGLHVH